jgi:SpoVK/Ycf46/Vps4 family AAA+-type ATPase
LLKTENHTLSGEQLEEIVQKTDGYSGADLRSLCTEAAFETLRGMRGDIKSMSSANVSPMTITQFESSLRKVKASVSPDEITQYLEWNTKFGSFAENATH